MKGLQRLMALWIVSRIACPERYERFTSRKFVRCVTVLRPSTVPNTPGIDGRGLVSWLKPRKVSPSAIARVLPLLGLCAAIILNAAWIGFLGYWIFRLVI